MSRYFIVPATADMVYQVSLNMREHDLQELMAVRWEKTREELASGLAKQYGGFPFVLCIGRDNVPIAILIGVAQHPGLWSVGMWATADLPKIGKFLTKFIRKEYTESIAACGARRVECKSIIGYDSVHKWLRSLGFEQSENVDRSYGRNGEDFVTFYIIVEDFLKRRSADS